MVNQIDMSDWYKFGDGNTADSYYHNDRDDVMMKLYFSYSGAKNEAAFEYEVASIAGELGLPVVHAQEYIVCEDRVGIIFDRVSNKESIGRAIESGSLDIAQSAKIMADTIKKFHSTPADMEKMTNITDLFKDAVMGCDKISFLEQMRIMQFLDGVDGAGVCLHGDFHTGNIIVADGKHYAIDLSRFSYGDPMFDIASLHFILKRRAVLTPDKLFDVYHITTEQAAQLWVEFCKHYAGIEGEDALNDYEEKLAPYCVCDVMLKGKATNFMHGALDILRGYMDLAWFSD